MEELTRRYKNLRNSCKTIIDEIIPILPSPDKFDFHLSYREISDQIEATLPLDLDAYKSFRKALGRSWKPHPNIGLSKLSRMYYINFIHLTGIILNIELHEDKEGSTCQMVETGTIEISVYEMKCN